MLQLQQTTVGRLANDSSLKTKDHDLGAVVGPLADSQVQIAVDFLSCKQPDMMDLKKIHKKVTQRATRRETITDARPCGNLLLHLFESTMQIELPPVKMINVEREVIIFPVVAGVGQNIPATFGEAQENVSKTKQHFN